MSKHTDFLMGVKIVLEKLDEKQLICGMYEATYRSGTYVCALGAYCKHIGINPKDYSHISYLAKAIDRITPVDIATVASLVDLNDSIDDNHFGSSALDKKKLREHRYSVVLDYINKELDYAN